MATIVEDFEKNFGQAPTGEYFAPGRINLIGEHTDYNGGHVFPAAITIGTYGAARMRDDQEIHLYSKNFAEQGTISFTLADLSYDKKDDWANYPKGVVHFLQVQGAQIKQGFDIFYYGNIPNGAGLSSSASIELLTGVILNDLFDLNFEMLDLVKIGKLVENEFIGVNSGIMDQFAVGMGQKDHGILLDTNTLDYEMVPAAFGKYVIVIMNTNKRRELADSKYNERRTECETALAKLQTKLSIQSLGELDVATFEANQNVIGDETLIKRARHAVTENARTLAAREALGEGDLVKFGTLLNESHTSLEKDYEVTGIELDTLAHTAQQQPGVPGARMTGAGFGGCGIALVDEEKVNDFIENVGKVYEAKMGYPASFYLAHIDDGARKLGGL